MWKEDSKTFIRQWKREKKNKNNNKEAERSELLSSEYQDSESH